MEGTSQKADAEKAEVAQAIASGGVALKGKAVEKRRVFFVWKVRAAKKAQKSGQKQGVCEHGGRSAPARARKSLKKNSDKARRGAKGASGLPVRNDCRGGGKASGTGCFSETVEIDAVTALVNAVEKATKARELASHQMHSTVKRAVDEVTLAEMKVTLWALFWAMENRGRTRQVAMVWAFLATTEDLVRSRFQAMRTEHDQEMELQRQLVCGV